MAYDPRVPALATFLDDPTNASGLGVGAIQGGCVYAHLCAGVTRGSGKSQAVQTATLNGLQAAMAYAAANGLQFVILGYYEIYGSAGLVAPLTSGFTWIGNVNTTIVQFYANAPCLTIGDGTGNNPPAVQRFTGFTLNYGVSQTGNTNAILLLVGGLYQSVIEQFQACSYFGSNPPWIGVSIQGASAAFYFQNVMRDGAIGGAQQSLLKCVVSGTGNDWINLYTHNGSNPSTRGALIGPGWDMRCVSQQSDNVFVRCNPEHFSTNCIINCNGFISTLMQGTHVEDVQLTGSYATGIQYQQGEINFTTLYLFDLVVASSATSVSVFGVGNTGEVIHVDHLKFKWDSTTGAAVTQALTLVNVSSYQGSDISCAIDVDRISVQDDVGSNAKYLTFDPNMASLPFTPGVVMEHYTYDNFLPTTRRAKPNITANYTHYGQHADAVLFVPATLSAAITITLSNKFKASGTGSTRVTPIGTVVRVRRQSGTYANTLTVVDAATGAGTPLTTNTTAGADLLYQFNGTNWVAFT